MDKFDYGWKCFEQAISPRDDFTVSGMRQITWLTTRARSLDRRGRASGRMQLADDCPEKE